MPDPKGKALDVATARRSPRLVAGADEVPVWEKLLASSMRATHAADTRQCFPETSLLRTRLRVQTQEEDPVNGSIFLRSKRFDKTFSLLPLNLRNQEKALEVTVVILKMTSSRGSLTGY